MRGNRILSAVAAILAVCAAAAAGPTVTGKVFMDTNGNGKLDAGEKGLPGVRVTDSVNFVTTGEDGSYKIEVADDTEIPHKQTQVVSVSWPSGTWPTGPSWARLDQIKGAADFGLAPQEQKRPFMFAHVTDNHGGPGYCNGLQRELTKFGPAMKFVVNTGDLFYVNYDMPGDPKPTETYESYMAGIKVMKTPLLHVPGNHDLLASNQVKADRKHPDYCNGLYTKYLGPIRWSFDYAGAHFVGVDWSTLQADGSVDLVTPPIAGEWLEKDLAPVKDGTPIVIFMHFPSAAGRFWAVANKHQVARALGGHGHRYERRDYGKVVATTAINLRGLQMTLGVISEGGADFLDRCPGCKGADPNYHAKLCALTQGPPGLGGLRGFAKNPKSVADLSLADGTKEIASLPGAGVCVRVNIDAPAGGKAGVRIGDKKTFEIACTPKGLLVGGAEVLYTTQGPAKLEIYIRNGEMIAYALPGLRWIRPVPVDMPGKVVLFAEGGTGFFKAISVADQTGGDMTPSGK